MKYIKKTIVDAYKITKYDLHSIYWDLNAPPPQWLLDAINDDIIYEKDGKIFCRDGTAEKPLNKNDYLIFSNGRIYRMAGNDFEKEYKIYYY